ncbi:hypothetical protein JAAARDRAFT_552216 [Jaapia argillacea MUCL 33604]|uniref:Uncharacterized protein n=1 Tax=Jaapia argillacea MUCL 33604 TaxID=933084 RepID=A0A067P705_9AGAM|nr:hypothetical protein JAAARDRAFT_552216 [Jaapia argillacea MUCL 33604]
MTRLLRQNSFKRSSTCPGQILVTLSSGVVPFSLRRRTAFITDALKSVNMRLRSSRISSAATTTEPSQPPRLLHMHGYTAPTDLYYSDFIIQSLAAFLKTTRGYVELQELNPDGTVKPRRNPVGALAMIAVAVERAFTTYFTGKFVPPPQKFSQQYTSAMVNDHLVNTRNLTPQRGRRYEKDVTE